MTTLRLSYLICSAVAAITAFVASVFWYRASRPTPQLTEPSSASISDNPEIHILGAQVDIGSIYGAFQQSSVLNKKAALWSAGSAFFAALTFALPLFGR